MNGKGTFRFIDWNNATAIVSLLATIALGLYVISQDAKLAKEIQQQAEAYAYAHEKYKIREDYLSELETLSHEFQTKFTQYADSLMTNNGADHSKKRKELLDNLLAQANQLMYLKDSVAGNKNIALIIDDHREKLLILKKSLSNGKDAGELLIQFNNIGKLIESSRAMKKEVRSLGIS